MAAIGQQGNGSGCHPLSLADPRLLRLIDIWEGLPEGVKLAIEKLCR
jgi:hypothetical protein